MTAGRFERFRCMAVTAVATIAAAFGLSKAFAIRINVSPSLPIGAYRVTADLRAHLVEFCPPEPYATLARARGYRGVGNCPDGGMPLMKPIVAVSGDLVELSARGIAVNGSLLPNTAPHSADTDGRPLPLWPTGFYRIAPGTLWVASTYDPRSFDSRYFGPIRAQQVRNNISPVFTFGKPAGTN